jgi:tRNA(Ile)-lysidine synthase
MLQDFKNHINKKFPELFRSKIAVAISGGRDSSVLAHLLHLSGIKFDLIHCNFNLRAAESDGDQAFVQQLAAQFNSLLHLESFDTAAHASSNKCSIQMAARDLRYQAFEKIALQQGLNHILTAHHLDDQLETFLINLGRGAGLHGLTGIRERKDIIIRPLLIFSGQQIHDFALSNHLTWREDSSNASTKYLRNKLRHEVIPLLLEALPHLETNFSKTLSYLKQSELLIEVSVARFRESGTTTNNGNLEINIQKLLATPQPQAYLFELLKDYNFNLPDALSLLQAEKGKSITDGKMRLTKEAEVLVLSDNETPQQLHLEINTYEGVYEIGDLKMILKHIHTNNPMSHVATTVLTSILYLDAATITMPLTVRNWQAGDRMQPYGMKGSKLISDVLTDRKVASLKREKALVLLCENKIIWLVGHRASKHHKITPTTTSILEISTI